MSPPTEQLIRDYLNRLSVAARGQLGSDDRRALVNRTRDFIERKTGLAGPPTAVEVARLLSGLGDPAGLVQQERQRLAAVRGEQPEPASRNWMARALRGAGGRPRPASWRWPVQEGSRADLQLTLLGSDGRPETRPERSQGDRTQGNRTQGNGTQGNGTQGTGRQETGAQGRRTPTGGPQASGPQAGGPQGTGSPQAGPQRAGQPRKPPQGNGIQGDRTQGTGTRGTGGPAGGASEPRRVFVPAQAADQDGPASRAAGPHPRDPAAPGDESAAARSAQGQPRTGPRPAGNGTRPLTPGAPGPVLTGAAVPPADPAPAEPSSRPPGAGQPPASGGTAGSTESLRAASPGDPASSGADRGDTSVIWLARQDIPPRGEHSDLVARLGAWARRQPVEASAIVLLGLGGAVFPPVWLIGAVVALGSRLWDHRDKWLALAMPVLLTVVAAVAGVALAGGRGVGHGVHEGWIFADIASRGCALLSAVYLGWRSYRGRRPPSVPPWNRPHKLS